jgi:hypothetical protein
MTRFIFAVVASVFVAAYGEGFDLTPEKYERAVAAEAEARVDREQPLRFEHAPSRYAVVTGNGQDVAAFIERYQTALWPDWRDDVRYAAHIDDAMARARKAGRAIIWTGSDEHRRAFVTACVALPIPGID